MRRSIFCTGYIVAILTVLGSAVNAQPPGSAPSDCESSRAVIARLADQVANHSAKFNDYAIETEKRFAALKEANAAAQRAALQNQAVALRRQMAFAIGKSVRYRRALRTIAALKVQIDALKSTSADVMSSAPTADKPALPPRAEISTIKPVVRTKKQQRKKQRRRQEQYEFDGYGYFAP